MKNEFSPIVPDAEITNIIASYNDEDGFVFLNPEYNATLTCVVSATVCVYGNKDLIDKMEKIINSSYFCDDFNELYLNTSILKVFNNEKILNYVSDGFDKNYFCFLKDFINESINKLKDFPELLNVIINNLNRSYFINNEIRDEEILNAFKSLTICSCIKTFFKTSFVRTSYTTGMFTLLSLEESAYQDFVCILSIMFPVLFYIERSNGTIMKNPELNNVYFQSVGIESAYYLLYNGMNFNYKSFKEEEFIKRFSILNTQIQSDPFEIIHLKHKTDRKGSTYVIDENEYFSMIEETNFDPENKHVFKKIVPFSSDTIPFYIFGLFDLNYYDLKNIKDNNLEPLINLILTKKFADLHDCLLEAEKNSIFSGTKDYFTAITEQYTCDISQGNIFLNSTDFSGISLNMFLQYISNQSFEVIIIKKLYYKSKPNLFLLISKSRLQIDIETTEMQMENDYEKNEYDFTTPLFD